MYHARSIYNPRTFGGLFENILQNGWNLGDNIETANPPVNILETEKGFELHLVAPGLNKENFKINVEQNVLSISFEKKEENKEQNEKWLRSEYKFRSFKRNFTLNDKIDTANINAKYADGILVVDLPKKEETAPAAQQITVK